MTLLHLKPFVKPENALHIVTYTSIFPLTRRQKSTCTLYKSAHYN